MATEGEGSVTRWIGDLKAGRPDAAQRLWQRYCAELVRLARARLGAAPRAAEDEEDVALSAFHSFYAAAARGRFPRLDDRDDLWRVLVTVTEWKAADLRQRQGQQKRGGGRVANAADVAAPGTDLFEQFAAIAPSPEFAAIVAEEFRRRLDALPDEVYRRVVLLKMEGYTDQEIADRLGCGLRSVSRKLALVRKAWLAEAPP
jgi:DNA-directed RNA polymerase specialized sigma24 family protein